MAMSEKKSHSGNQLEGSLLAPACNCEQEQQKANEEASCANRPEEREFLALLLAFLQ